jgi:hypothetical protein
MDIIAFLMRVDLPVPENPEIMIAFKGPRPFCIYSILFLRDDMTANLMY